MFRVGVRRPYPIWNYQVRRHGEALFGGNRHGDEIIRDDWFPVGQTSLAMPMV